MNRTHLFILGLLWMIWIFPHFLQAQTNVPETGIEGVIVDARNGDTIPFVQIYFVGTGIGTTSDPNGHFRISNNQGHITLAFKAMGYKTEIRTLKPNRFVSGETIKLQDDVYELQAFVVKPKRRKVKYKRKNNPAVDLIKNVIAHKNDLRLENQERYKVDCYEKLVMSLDKMDINYDRNRFTKSLELPLETPPSLPPRNGR